MTALRLLIGVVLVSLGAAAPAAATPGVESFRVTVTFRQTTVVSGNLMCAEGPTAPATASETVRFSTPRSRTLQFVYGGGQWTVANFHSRRGGGTTLSARGTVHRRSDFASSGATAAVCPGGAPDPRCGSTTLRRIALIIQTAGSDFTLDDIGITPRVRGCEAPAPFTLARLGLLGSTGEKGVRYSARLPRSLLDRHRRLFVIHGHARWTGTTNITDFSVPGVDDYDAKGTTTVAFTMRLRRVAA